MKTIATTAAGIATGAIIATAVLFGGSVNAQFTEEYPSFAGMTKQEAAQQIRSQNFELSDPQIQQVKRFLSTYQVQATDVKFLKQLAEANGFQYDKIKDTAFVQRLIASSTLRVVDAASVLDREDRTKLKQDRILRLKQHLPVTRQTELFDFEVVDIEAIEKGIAVYVRAFHKDGTQIGFGADGTVDIERIQMKHPVVLVRDAAGDIVREYKRVDAFTGEVEREWSVTLKEDYVAGVLYDLVLATKNQLTLGVESNIIPGKVGNTTTTVRPDAGTSDGDTDTQILDVTTTIGSWDSIHDLSAGDTNNNTATGLDARIRSHLSNNWLAIYRPILGFDTSAVGTDSVSAATLTLTADGAFQDSFNQDLAIDHATPPSGGGAFATSDYANANFDATDQAPRMDLGSWSSTDGNTNDFVLNATGRGNINGSGDTFFAPRMSADIDDNPPTWSSNTSSYASFYSADETGTTDDPVLVITHSEGGGEEEATTTPATVWYGNTVISGNTVVF